MATEQEQLSRQADDLYERYARPLESAHRGEYVAVSVGGDTVLGSSVQDVLKRAAATFGPGNFIFRVGEKAVGRWL